MSTSVWSAEGGASQELRLGPVAGMARRLVLDRLARFGGGTIEVQEGRERHVLGTGNSGLRARVQVCSPRFYPAVALGGGTGAAEAYVQGWWQCDDLVTLCRIGALNLLHQGRMDLGWSRAAAMADRLRHALRRNTRKGSRRNIAAHYDLSNEFFSLFLDREMMYSCAVFPHAESTLEEASFHKLEVICRKLDLGPADHLLEIGTGWGGLALHAAGRYGCRVTTTTISAQQAGLARQRVAQAGLQDRVEVVMEDYRQLRGRYDKLVSVEMIEAVGHHYYEAYFRQCAALLKPEGLMLLQGITIADWAYGPHRYAVDFIKKHIFPGSCIPSVSALGQAMAAGSDLRLVDLQEIGPHYVPTLDAWRQRFLGNLEAVRRLGFDERFIRLWTYYLCYCQAGFQERYLGDAQLLLAKPLNRSRPAQERLAAPDAR